MSSLIINPLRNEIFRLLTNIARANETAALIPEDRKAYEVLYTIGQITRGNTHPKKFDFAGNGSIKPDIVAYLCPDFSLVGDLEFEQFSREVMALEDKMPVHQVGIEHFMISNYSYKNKKGKVTSKVSEAEYQIYCQTKNFEDLRIYKDYTKIDIRDKVDLFTSFGSVYQKHYNQKNEYLENIYINNFMGNAVKIDQRMPIPIWFLIECDDALFYDSETKCEVPIFFTKEGFDIMDSIGFVDGYIYYGSDLLYIISTNYLSQISESIRARVTSKLAVAQREYWFKDNHLYKNMNHYWKVVI